MPVTNRAAKFKRILTPIFRFRCRAGTLTAIRIAAIGNNVSTRILCTKCGNGEKARMKVRRYTARGNTQRNGMAAISVVR